MSRDLDITSVENPFSEVSALVPATFVSLRPSAQFGLTLQACSEFEAATVVRLNGITAPDIEVLHHNIPLSEVERIASELDRALATGDDLDLHWKVEHPTLGGRWLRVVARLDRSHSSYPLWNGILEDVTPYKTIEQKNIALIAQFAKIDRINRVIQSHTDLELMMEAVLLVAARIFEVDRAVLMYPCNTSATTCAVPMHVERESAGQYKAMRVKGQMPITDGLRECNRLLLDGESPLTAGDGNRYPLPQGEKLDNVKAILAHVITPKLGEPWVLALHQFDTSRVWTEAECDLIRELGDRLSESLSNLQTYRNLQESEFRFRQLAETINEAFWLVDYQQTKMLYMSPAFETIWQRDLAEIMQNPAKRFDYVHPDDLREYKKVVARMMKHENLLADYRIVTPDGQIKYIQEKAYLIFDEHSNVSRIAGVSQDVTHQKLQQRQIQFLAYHDPLTKLKNRTAINEMLAKAIAEHAESSKLLGVMFFDLDSFKSVNDKLGHQVGDALLVAVAGMVCECTSAKCTAGRYGGDEFLVVLENLKSKDEANAIAHQLLSKIDRPVDVLGNHIRPTVSIGLSCFPEHGHDPTKLLKSADTALSLAKSRGKNQVQMYSSELDRRVRAREKIEFDLKHAIPSEQFFLVYQPQFDAADNRLVGAEALLRWRHPENGLIPPNEFIPIAEQTNLIDKIGRWVLFEALSQCAKWVKKFEQQFTVSVNISPRQLEDEYFHELIQQAILKTGCPPERIELEVTESSTMTDPDQATKRLESIRAMGIRVAIDDFGTGYSNLAYLKRLPIDRLKIDRSMVANITHDADDLAIINTIAVLARQMRLELIAEGIETDAQRKLLVENHCHLQQGYWFSKPLPVDEFEGKYLGS